MVSQNSSITELIADLERQEIECLHPSDNNQSGGGLLSLYKRLLLLYLLQNDTISAKFLWKRIPLQMKEDDRDLQKVWSLGKLLWLRDFEQIFPLLNDEWIGELQPLIIQLRDNLHTRVAVMVSRAYSCISLDALAKKLGISTENAMQWALDRNWSVSDDKLYIEPQKDSSPKAIDSIPNEEQLSLLTSYVSYLEN